MAQKVPTRQRGRKRTFPMFNDGTAAANLPPDEVIRLAFPALTRCDHCGELDGATQRVLVGKEKRWLHEQCRAAFKPVASTPVRRNHGQYVVYPDDEPEPKGSVVGALVKIGDAFEAWRYNRGNEPIACEPTAQAAFDAFPMSQAPALPGELGPVRRLLRSPHSDDVESVRWCGGVRQCACYGSGEILAEKSYETIFGEVKAYFQLGHKFRWECAQDGLRRVKVLK